MQCLHALITVLIHCIKGAPRIKSLKRKRNIFLIFDPFRLPVPQHVETRRYPEEDWKITQKHYKLSGVLPLLFYQIIIDKHTKMITVYIPDYVKIAL